MEIPCINHILLCSFSLIIYYICFCTAVSEIWIYTLFLRRRIQYLETLSFIESIWPGSLSKRGTDQAGQHWQPLSWGRQPRIEADDEPFCKKKICHMTRWLPLIYISSLYLATSVTTMTWVHLSSRLDSCFIFSESVTLERGERERCPTGLFLWGQEEILLS